MRGKKQNPDSGVLYLDFGFAEPEKKAETEDIGPLPFFPSPGNDNQRLLNLQHGYYHGREEALGEMFLLLSRIAGKMISRETKEKRLFFTAEKKRELALDSAELVVRQILKNRLKIRKSFTAYLYLQVRKTMYSRTKAEKLEAYCARNRIDLLSLSESERRQVRKQMEEEEK